MLSSGGKIPSGGGGLNKVSLKTGVPQKLNASSKVGASKNTDKGKRADADGNQALAFAMPGVSSSEAAKKAAGSNVATRFAAAEGQGAQNFSAMGGISQGGGSSKPFIPLDSSKMGLEGIAKAFSGMGSAFTEIQKAFSAKKDGGNEGGQDQAAAQQAQMFAQNDGAQSGTDA